MQTNLSENNFNTILKESIKNRNGDILMACVDIRNKYGVEVWRLIIPILAHRLSCKNISVILRLFSDSHMAQKNTDKELDEAIWSLLVSMERLSYIKIKTKMLETASKIAKLRGEVSVFLLYNELESYGVPQPLLFDLSQKYPSVFDGVL